MRSALTDAPRNVCDCGQEIALVDSAFKKQGKNKGQRSGGKWVHVELPDNYHLARPRKGKK